MTTPRIRRQRGLSLVELMVALTLGLLILAGVLQLFLGSKRAYVNNQALARVQDSGRFALEFLGFDFRNAGYKGTCITAVNNLLDPGGTGYEEALFDLESPVLGWDDEAGPFSDLLVGYRSGTDAVLVKHAANGSEATASGSTPANANAIALTAAGGVPQGAIVLVSDGRGCDLFQNRSQSNASTLSRGNTGTPGNLNPASVTFSHAYGPDMEITLFRSALYYVGRGSSGVPSLRRVRFDSGSAPIEEELVEGVLDMQILYGVDTTGNRQAGEYVGAGEVTDWSQVVSARIQLLVVSAETNIATEPQSVFFNGTSVNIPDDRLGLVFTNTVGIRNRLP